VNQPPNRPNHGLDFPSSAACKCRPTTHAAATTQADGRINNFSIIDGSRWIDAKIWYALILLPLPWHLQICSSFKIENTVSRVSGHPNAFALVGLDTARTAQHCHSPRRYLALLNKKNSAIHFPLESSPLAHPFSNPLSNHRRAPPRRSPPARPTTILPLHRAPSTAARLPPSTPLSSSVMQLPFCIAPAPVKVPSLILANWWNLGLTFVSKWMI
jgi:hypothetical protein